MALSTAFQAAVVISAFLLPITLYILFMRGAHPTSKTKTKSAEGAGAGPLPPPTRITKILIHPIKSCHGISVPSAQLLPTGLDLDRQWMWTSYPDHKFLTIRTLSKMTLIRPSYNSTTDTLTITAPSPSHSSSAPLTFTIPAHPSKSWLSQNTTKVSATVWSTTTPAYAYSTDLTGPFNEFFNQEVRLVYKPPFDSDPRPLVSNGAENILGRKASTSFPDLMPILVGNEASIAELNTRLSDAGEDVSIGIERFRPNIIVQGQRDKPWDEDRWKTIRIGDDAKPQTSFTLDITQRCARCRVPNVDPETAEQHKKQPWDTLMKYRRVDAGITFKPCFGMLCVPRGSGGEVRVGMELGVTEVTSKHRYIGGF
ncbi:hypothetical protein B0J11DRAFT_596420 [Dendryphion nanum]|uniref:MOSC domain-containing protein n=1 Tax=Dendryphion nanum TaxID=256645 RepID=A0A9P9EE23_9PLEO|nr:hypothetical protein B0J11DRAFT_596420 [Dendryphion nanum]